MSKKPLTLEEQIQKSMNKINNKYVSIDIVGERKLKPIPSLDKIKERFNELTTEPQYGIEPPAEGEHYSNIVELPPLTNKQAYKKIMEDWVIENFGFGKTSETNMSYLQANSIKEKLNLIGKDEDFSMEDLLFKEETKNEAMKLIQRTIDKDFTVKENKEWFYKWIFGSK